ncbi:MAG: AsmA-like C-terminal region-containing protein [Candidatus Methylacidiphilales bacterium]|nr:AsmA-like C-terminal region-containing protein [Candidatus Methylacidiphilales bacterium]
MNTEISKRGTGAKAEAGGRRRHWTWPRFFSYGLLAVLLLVLVVLMGFRYYGLPEAIGVRLRDELAKKGLAVDFRRLYLDPFGRVVAEDLQVRRQERDMSQNLLVEKLRFSFNWISWWRGEPFLEAASMSGADLEVPLDGETSVRLEAVNADVRFKPGQLVVRDFRARLLNLNLHASGTLDYAGFQPGAPLTAEKIRARAAAWRSVEKILGEFGGERPMNLDIEARINLARMDDCTARIVLDGKRQEWRGVICERILADIRYENRLAQVEFETAFLRGGVRVEGAWSQGQKQARVSFDADADVSLMAPAFPGGVGEWLKDVRFRTLPGLEGTVDLDWSEGLRYLIVGRANWRDFTVKDAYFESLYLPLSFDGKRIMVPGLTLRGSRGRADLELFYDGQETFKAKLDSTIDPTQFAPLFGSGAKPFFDSLKFRNDGPVVHADFQGRGLRKEGMTVSGRVQAFDFSYKGVALKEVGSSFRYADDEIDLPDLHLRREEGEGSGAVRHNFRTRIVVLKNVKARLHLAETARIISSKLEEYAQPYRFLAAPYAEAEGTVDVDHQKLTDLKVHVVSPEGMDYKFLGKDVRLTDLDADLGFKGMELKILPRKPVGLFGGKAELDLGITLTPEAPYRAKAKMTDADFGALMRTYFGNSEISGRVSGQINLRGLLNDMKSIDGFGTMAVTKGAIYDIPMFGGFSQVLNSIVPNLGYAVADKAQAEYIFKNGVIQMDKVDVAATTFALIGKGTYDYVNDRVDMNMRVNMRGLMGIALFPVSKLFEYEGKGTLNDTKWGPKMF